MMRNFITLTNLEGNRITINPKSICRFYRDHVNDTCLVYMNGSDRYFKETPEQILEMLQPKPEATEVVHLEAWRSMLPGGVI